MPAASSIASIVSATTSVVPRSGSITIRPQAISAGHATGLATSHQLRARLARDGELLGGVQDQRQLGDLRRLELDRPGAEPASGALHLHAEMRNQHEHEQRP